MNIIKNKKILKSFGQQIDQLNTLAGGVSMAHFEVEKKEDRTVVNVFAPSVHPESMQIMVEYNKLIVYATMAQNNENEGAQAGFSFPLFARVIEIPFHVAVDQIEAVHEDGHLSIVLPYAEDRLNNKRTIRIQQR